VGANYFSGEASPPGPGLATALYKKLVKENLAVIKGSVLLIAKLPR